MIVDKRSIKNRSRILFLLMVLGFPFNSLVIAQGTLGSVAQHFDSICRNCTESELVQAMIPAIREQDSLIAKKGNHYY